MDIVSALPRSPKGNNTIWVIIDHLTKSAHFIPFRVGQSTKVQTDKYMREIIPLHRVSVSIVLDRDTRFMSNVWECLQKVWRLILNSTHLISQRQTGSLNAQILENMLRDCMLEFKGSWEDHLHMAEFSYKNSYQASIKMAQFEALYGRNCRSLLCWDEVGDILDQRL